MKRRVFRLITSAVLTVCCLSPCLAAEGAGVNLLFDGKRAELEQPAVIKSGRTMIPLRAAAEGLGAEVSWESTSKTAVFSKDGVKAYVEIGSPRLKIVSGEAESVVEIDSPAVIENGRTLAPIGILTEYFGYNANYDKETKTVNIVKADKGYKIGIIKAYGTELLNRAEQGFYDALSDKGLVDGENLTVKALDGNVPLEEYEKYAKEFADSSTDLLFVTGSGAAQNTLKYCENIPIVGTAITNYVGAGLTDSLEKPDKNITGTTDCFPTAEAARLITELCPNTKKIGLIYSEDEEAYITSEITSFKEACAELGAEAAAEAVTDTDSFCNAVEKLSADCGAVYVITDSDILSHLYAYPEIFKEKGLPAFCGDSLQYTEGQFVASVSPDYYGLGYQAGVMASRILLNSVSPADIPIEAAKSFEYCFDKETADALGIEIPEKYSKQILKSEE